MALASRPNLATSFLSRSRHSARPSLESLEPRLVPADFTVTSYGIDGSPGTLRDCIAQANALAGPDRILITTSTPIVLSSVLGQLQITDALTITASGVPLALIQRNGGVQFRLFDITAAAGSVSLTGLELSGGSSTGSGVAGSGGAIFNAANLLIQNCYIHDNAGGGFGGGGISTTGNLTVLDSLIKANTGDSGAGIFSAGATGLSISGSTIEANVAASYAAGVNAIGTTTPVQITDSLFIDNVAPASGGGLFIREANANITGTTFQNNHSGFGAGILAETTGTGAITINLVNSTFSGNQSTQTGGALGTTANYSGITVDFYDCTVANNTAAFATGGAYAYSLNGGFAHLIYQGTLFANNSHQNFYTYPGATNTLTSLGNNLSTDSTGMTASDVVTSTPFLGTLGNNGGPTLPNYGSTPTTYLPTFALLPGSPALDAGVANHGITLDQLGVSRPQGSAPDIGAFEAVPYAYSPSGDGQSTFASFAFPSPLSLTITQASMGVSGTSVTFTVTSGIATFSNGLASITVVTDASGNVSVPLTAGGIVGPVQVTARVGAKLVATYNESVATAPQLNISTSDEFTHVAETFTRNFSVTGVGNVTVFVTYADGGEPQIIFPDEGGNFTLSNAYPTEGSDHVTVTLRDTNGNQLDQKSFDIDVLLAGVPTDQADKQTTVAGVVTAREPGVTATLTHLIPNPDGSDASIIVAVVPTFVAAGLNGSTQIGDKTITTAYDVRATNINEHDSVTIVFHYFNDDFDLPVLRYYNRTTKREEVVDSRLFVVDRFARTITLLLDEHSRPAIRDISGTVFTIAVPLAVSVPPAPAPVSSPTVDPTAAGSVQQASRGSGGGALGSGGGGGGLGGGGPDGVAFALAQVTGSGAVLAFATTTTLAALPDAPSSSVDKKGVLRDLPAVPDSLITLPGPILTPGSAEMSAPLDSSDTTTPPDTTAPPDTAAPPTPIGRLDGDLEAADVFVFEATALDEVFVSLGESRLHSRYDVGDEPRTDWRDMTLAVAAVLASRPATPRRLRRSPVAPGER